MKKYISIFLVIAMIFSLAACGSKSKAPAGWDENLYEYAEAAYELVHDYNLGKVSKADAQERANRLYDTVKALQVVDKDPKYVSNEVHQLSITTNLLSFSVALTSGTETVSVEQDLKKLLEK